MRYGVPYRGSKNKIAPWIISNLPAGAMMVDLFAGGCAVTHAALLSDKWSHVIANDIGDAQYLFMDAIHGKYANEKRWISREDFHHLKAIDPYVSLCWSFGNNRTDYLYSREIEPWKKALHFARVFNDTTLLRKFGIDSDGSKKDIRNHYMEYSANYEQWCAHHITSHRFDSLESLERLQALQSLRALERLQGLSSLAPKTALKILQMDYQRVEIPKGAIVYADPPYSGTRCTGYYGNFDYPEFERWLAEVPFMVIISEYAAPAGCIEIASIHRQCQISTGNKYGSVTEKLFVQERFLTRYHEMMHEKRS